MATKRFSFSLQRLLNLRAFEETRARIELGKAVSEVERVNSSLRDNAARRVAAWVSEEARSGEGGEALSARAAMDVESLLAVERYVLRLDFERDRLLEKLAAAEAVAEEKREVYVEAAKKLKTIDKLKEKKIEQWRKESLVEMDNEIDDIVSSHEGDSGLRLTSSSIDFPLKNSL